MFGDTERPFIFQHENAPHHSAKIINNFLKEASIGVLNIIENVWLYIKDKINLDPVDVPKTKDALISRVLQEWSNIPMNFIKELYGSIPRRLRTALKVLSYPTKY